MGNTTGLEVKVRADISDLKSKVTEAKAQVAGLGQSATVAAGPIAKMGEEVTKAAAKTTVMASATSTLKSNLLSIINPTTLLVTGLTAIGVTVYNFITKETEAAKATRLWNEALAVTAKEIAKITESLSKEAAKVDIIVASLRNENLSREQRNEAIKELQKISPAYFGNLDKEKATIDQITHSYDLYTKSLIASITAKSREKQLTEVIDKILILEDKKNKAQKEQVAIGGKLVTVQNARMQTLEEEQSGVKNLTLLTNKENDELKQLYITRKKLADLSAAATQGSQFSVVPKEVKIKPEKIKIDASKAKVEIDELKQRIILPEKGVAPSRGESQDPYGVLSGRKTPGTTDSLAIMLEKRKKALLELSNIVTSVLSPALDSVFDNIGKGANKVVQSLGNVIKQLSIAVFKALALQAIASLLPGGATLNIGNVLKSVLGGFATGTRSVGQAGVYNVGERGPERIFLPQGASVQPNNELQAYGGGGINLMPSIAYDGTMFRIFLNRVDAQISRNG